eukprot:CAMPEP_0206148310 /NCGR_PEP_ID=MMETSP1473-20131121/36254_1 /ASSEMBLY_ACC=CAM_ASM_001109 /TAXON_ID=1461547 /ORGANISM="Stichococcus sp, Strain RCC1054" /LENGTH=44 /DNA_ID= /DNA_START= /DNA_END= /DNA_ORIENTATION=
MTDGERWEFMLSSITAARAPAMRGYGASQEAIGALGHFWWTTGL